MVLCPDRTHHRHTAVNADHNQDVHTGKHVEETESAVEFAHELAKRPVEVHCCIRHTEREEGSEEEVCYSKVQKPDRVDRPFHFESSNPNDNAIPHHSKYKSQTVDYQWHDVKRFPEICILIIFIVIFILGWVVIERIHLCFFKPRLTEQIWYLVNNCKQSDIPKLDLYRKGTN